MAVPYTFGSATTSIPLSQLDSNFATTITLGNTAVQLGNTITTLTGVTNVSSATSLTLGSGSAGNTAVTITTGGNLLIGSTTNYGSKVYASAGGSSSPASSGNMTTGYIFGAGDGAQALNFGQDSNGTWYNSAYVNNAGVGLNHRWYVGGSEVVRIDSSGNVGIGTASPTQKLQVAGNAFISAGQYFMWDNAGAWSWQSDASSYLRAYTSGNERMRIDSSGTVLIGKTSGDDTVTGIKFGNGSGDRVFTAATSASWGVMVNRQGDDGKAINFRRGNTDVGSINVTSSATSYNTSSDYRLKENITPMTGALAKVALLKPVTYKWKVDGSDGEGFIAHELAEVKPDCVSGDKDAVDADGNPVYQGIDVSFLVATLTAAIQELKAINDTQAETINALTARIVALEAK